MIRIVALEPAYLPAFAELFEASSSTCFCWFWHFEGTKNDWLARAANDPSASRDDHARLARAGDPRAGGLLALEDGPVTARPRGEAILMAPRPRETATARPRGEAILMAPRPRETATARPRGEAILMAPRPRETATARPRGEAILMAPRPRETATARPRGEAILMAPRPRETATARPHDRAVGWMKLTPRGLMPKLRKLPVYRALELGNDDGVWTIGCFLIRPDSRSQGIARALLLAADAYVRSHGGRAIEAYPRHSDEAMHAEEAWMGPERLFHSCGFACVTAPSGQGESVTRSYPVLRKYVGEGATPEGCFATHSKASP